MGLTRDEVLDIQRYAREPISLDQALEQRGEALLGEFLRCCPSLDAMETISRAAATTAAHGPGHPLRRRSQHRPTEIRARRRSTTHYRGHQPSPRTFTRTYPRNRSPGDGQTTPPLPRPRPARLPRLTQHQRPAGGWPISSPTNAVGSRISLGVGSCGDRLMHITPSPSPSCDDAGESADPHRKGNHEQTPRTSQRLSWHPAKW
jgi:hypothetical protein